MDGQLAQVCLTSHFLPELASPVENLSPEVAELRALVHRLQAENHSFRQQAAYRKSRNSHNMKHINVLELKIVTSQKYRLFRFLVRASRDLWAFLLGEGRFPRHSHLSPEDPKYRDEWHGSW